MAAIELIHKQPVRWVKERTVKCDGGGGPLGHPRIFINVDRPQICWCTYCGLPYVCYEIRSSQTTHRINSVFHRPRSPTARCSSLFPRLLTLLSLPATRQRSPRDTRATPESLWNSDRCCLFGLSSNLRLAFSSVRCSVYNLNHEININISKRLHIKQELHTCLLRSKTWQDIIILIIDWALGFCFDPY